MFKLCNTLLRGKVLLFQPVKSATCLNPVPVTGVVGTGLKFVTLLLY